MDYFDFSKLMDEALEKVLEEEDDSSLLADYAHKLFNQGARAMFYEVLVRVAELCTKEACDHEHGA